MYQQRMLRYDSKLYNPRNKRHIQSIGKPISNTTGREYRREQKPISNHLSRVRVTIVWSLWRHHQPTVTSSASELYPGMMCEDPRF